MTENPNTTRPLRYILLGMLLIIPLFFLYLKMSNGNGKVKKATHRVLVMQAKPTDSVVELVFPSVTEAHHITPIWARANGYLAKLNVDIGDVVKKGQLLAEIETPEIDELYRQADFDYQNAKVKRKIAALNAKRAINLTKVNAQAISEQNRDEFVAAYLEAKKAARALFASKKRYKALMEFKKIVAPFDGTIMERSIDTGSLVSAGSSGQPQQLFVIGSCDTIRVFVQVPQMHFRSVYKGMTAITRIREFGDKEFTSTVERYAKALDPVSHTMQTELHIPNPDGRLFPGLYADVTMRFQPKLAYYIVPTSSVIIRTGDPKIAVLDDQNVVHLKCVEIGLDFGKSLQIVSGIEPSDRIIVNPTDKTRDGLQLRNVWSYGS